MFDFLTSIDAEMKKAVATALGQAKAEVEAPESQAASATPEAAGHSYTATEATIELAMENMGISGVDVQIDETGFARLVGEVVSESQRDAAIQMAENFELTGMEVALEVIAPPVVEAVTEDNPWGADASLVYTTKRGDSWWGIAKRYYGDGGKWKALKAHNGSPRMLHPNAEVKVPRELA